MQQVGCKAAWYLWSLQTLLHQSPNELIQDQHLSLWFSFETFCLLLCILPLVFVEEDHFEVAQRCREDKRGHIDTVIFSFFCHLFSDFYKNQPWDFHPAALNLDSTFQSIVSSSFSTFLPSIPPLISLPLQLESPLRQLGHRAYEDLSLYPPDRRYMCSRKPLRSTWKLSQPPSYVMKLPHRTVED